MLMLIAHPPVKNLIFFLFFLLGGGGGEVFKGKKEKQKETIKLHWDFQRGRESQNKIPSVEEREGGKNIFF